MTVEETVASRVGDALRDAGYTAEGVLDRLGAAALAAIGQDQPQPARRVLARTPARDPQDPRDAFIRLFLLGETVPGSAMDTSLAHDLVSLGLVTAAAEGLRASLDVRPYGEPDTDWYLVSDRGHPEHADHVLGLGGASMTLARVTPRHPAARVLDLGCGAGVQALHAARHAQQVTVTDTNPRALELTGLSALLSGLGPDRVRPLAGSLFEPVAGELFDLIVSNPPFVISPGHRFTYRDAGLPGDELSRQVIRGAAGHLAPGGRAAVLGNWLHRPGERWSDRVASWIDGTGVSAWIVQRETQSCVDYALTWLRDSGTHEADLDTALDEWLDEFESQGAEAVGFGWVVLQAPGPADERETEELAQSHATDPVPEPWLVVEDLSASPRLPDSSEVADFIHGCDRLASTAFADLLGRAWRLADGVVIERVSTVVGDREVEVPPRLGLAGHIGATGWRPAVPAPPLLCQALLASHDTSLGARLDEAAAVAGVDPLDVLPTALVALRELIRTAIVTSD